MQDSSNESMMEVNRGKASLMVRVEYDINFIQITLIAAYQALGCIVLFFA